MHRKSVYDFKDARKRDDNARFFIDVKRTLSGVKKMYDRVMNQFVLIPSDESSQQKNLVINHTLMELMKSLALWRVFNKLPEDFYTLFHAKCFSSHFESK